MAIETTAEARGIFRGLHKAGKFYEPEGTPDWFVYQWHDINHSKEHRDEFGYVHITKYAWEALEMHRPEMRTMLRAISREKPSIWVAIQAIFRAVVSWILGGWR